MACTTRWQGTFVREFTQSPVGPISPNNSQVVFDLFNFFEFNDAGQFVDDAIRIDNYGVLQQLGQLPG